MTTSSYKVGDKEFPMPQTSPGGQSKLAEGIKQLTERIEAENQAKSTTEIILDKSNKVSFPGYPYKFESLGEKILVSIDVFKSGYECKECKGKKVIKYMCVCEANGHSGLKYSEDALKAIAESLGEDIALARRSMVCDECNGDYEAQRKEETCSACKGIGALLIIPDTSKSLVTTGVVVSMGSKCDPKELNFDIGDRIIFGPYAGNMIPTKAGLAFKIIDASQAWCKVEGGEDLSAFDFVIQDKEAL